MFVVIGNLCNSMSVPFMILERKEDVEAFVKKISKVTPVRNLKKWDTESKSYIDLGVSSFELHEHGGSVSFEDEVPSEFCFKDGAYFQNDGFYSLSFKKINVGDFFLEYWSDD